MGDLITCPCNHCSGFLEFDPDAAGQSVPCPFCGLETTLFNHVGDKPCPTGDTICPPPSTQSTPPQDTFRPDTTVRLCATCGSVARPWNHTPGSIGIELLLWLCFLLPGVLYSIWRLASRKPACPHCLSHDLLPIDTPRAQHLAAQLGVDTHVYVRSRPSRPMATMAKAILIVAAVIAFAVLYHQARENEAAMRDLDRLERTLR